MTKETTEQQYKRQNMLVMWSIIFGVSISGVIFNDMILRGVFGIAMSVSCFLVILNIGPK